MIIRFQLENFLSFNDIQNFSMIPGNLKTKKDHVFAENGVKLLNLSAIYGANASGKTSLIKAIDLFRFIIRGRLPSNVDAMYHREDDANRTKPTKFEVEFIKNDKIYAYGIEVFLNKKQIKSEWLYEMDPLKDEEHMIYERELIKDEYTFRYNEKLILGDDQKRLKFVVFDMQTNNQVLLLTEMNRNKKIDKDSTLYFFQEVYNWFVNDLKIFFPDDTITKFDYVIGKDKAGNEAINNIVSSFDTGISSVSLEKINKDELMDVLPKEIIENIVSDIRNNTKDNQKIRVTDSVLRNKEEFFQISNVSNDDYEVETIKLRHGLSEVSYDFREESDGTRRLFDLLDILLYANNNKIFIVDELDRSLHPNLTYKFIELFYKIASKKNIQLIFTTHESKIMDLNLVRQDEIWFVERNKQNESELYSLDAFKERYDKRIEKAYLEGRYGAIPIFNSFGAFIHDEGED